MMMMMMMMMIITEGESRGGGEIKDIHSANDQLLLITYTASGVFRSSVTGRKGGAETEIW